MSEFGESGSITTVKEFDFEDGRHQITIVNGQGVEMGVMWVASLDYLVGGPANTATFDVATLRDYRGAGVGTKLLSLGEDWAREHGFKRLEGDFSPDISISAPVLKKFYEKNGYQVRGDKVSKKL